MIPSLFTFTLLAALVLLAFGLFLSFAPARATPVLRSFPRHRLTGVITMALAGSWFLWKIANLGPSDFGDYKVILFILFAATVAGSIFYVPDFLAVRGVAVLILLSANVGLKAAFGHYDIPERLLLVMLLYVFIVAAIYYGLVPFKMRETMAWLLRGEGRVRALGALSGLTGATLLLTAFLY